LIAERHVRLAVLLVLAMAASTPRALAASPAEIATQRQEALDDILHTDTAYTVAADRQICAGGKIPAQSPAGIYAKALLVQSSRTGAQCLARTLAEDLVACPSLRESLWPEAVEGGAA